LGGRLKDGEFSDYSLPWEPEYYQGSGYKARFKVQNGTFLGLPTYEYSDRIIGGESDSNSDFYSSQDAPYQSPVYFEKFEQGLLGNSENLHFGASAGLRRRQRTVHSGNALYLLQPI
jgi:hypothetical protein